MISSKFLRKVIEDTPSPDSDFFIIVRFCANNSPCKHDDGLQVHETEHKQL